MDGCTVSWPIPDRQDQLDKQRVFVHLVDPDWSQSATTTVCVRVVVDVDVAAT